MLYALRPGVPSARSYLRTKDNKNDKITFIEKVFLFKRDEAQVSDGERVGERAGGEVREEARVQLMLWQQIFAPTNERNQQNK